MSERESAELNLRVQEDILSTFQSRLWQLEKELFAKRTAWEQCQAETERARTRCNSLQQNVDDAAAALVALNNEEPAHAIS